MEPVTCLRAGSDLTLVTYGILTNEALAAADKLAADGIGAEVLKLGQIHPLETECILPSLQKTGRLIVAEDVCEAGCVGARILAAAAQNGMELKVSRLINLKNGLVQHGAPAVLMEKCGLNADAIAAAARDMLTAGEGNTQHEENQT